MAQTTKTDYMMDKNSTTYTQNEKYYDIHGSQTFILGNVKKVLIWNGIKYIPKENAF
jgi:hypothetical protein